MKKGILICWLVVLLGCIGSLFWYNELKYSLPTPKPENYSAVREGSLVNVSDKIKSEDNKPLFLHFFNPSCPCSRFNMPHFKSLVKEYNGRVNFAIVVMNKDNKYTAKEVQEKFDLDIPVIFDNSVAAACGVYSTPQAVLLTTDHKLYYRGNYNKSRYCTDKKSDYAQMAIDSLLNNNTNPVFNQYALTAYGCQLPNCTK